MTVAMSNDMPAARQRTSRAPADARVFAPTGAYRRDARAVGRAAQRGMPEACAAGGGTRPTAVRTRRAVRGRAHARPDAARPRPAIRRPAGLEPGAFQRWMAGLGVSARPPGTFPTARVRGARGSLCVGCDGGALDGAVGVREQDRKIWSFVE